MANEIRANWRYDVFLSFRGIDTRLITFTGNLYNALRRKRFKVFMDEEELKSGTEISLSILQALENSRISIVVLSQNYARSRRRLNELVNILQCMKNKNQLVLPIFYDVDPSVVRYHQTHNHKCRFGKKAVKQWRSALSEVSNLRGLHFKIGNGYEFEFIQDIVEWVTKMVPRYDVFLSFSRKDTGYSFTNFLHNALHREGFKTFVNDEEVLDDVDQISQSLISAIEKSKLSIIVFSENYAYSSSCLDELVTILDCMKIKNQLVWPIFYKVEPSDLRHQRNNYGKAMAEHEQRYGKDSHKVHKWRSVLFEVANLKG